MFWMLGSAFIAVATTLTANKYFDKPKTHPGSEQNRENMRDSERRLQELEAGYANLMRSHVDLRKKSALGVVAIILSHLEHDHHFNRERLQASAVAFTKALELLE